MLAILALLISGGLALTVASLPSVRSGWSGWWLRQFFSYLFWYFYTPLANITSIRGFQFIGTGVAKKKLGFILKKSLVVVALFVGCASKKVA